MDETELARRTSRLPARYQARLDIETYADIDRSVRVGEWGEALAELIAGLQQTHAAVTIEERDELSALLVAIHEPTDQLDTLTVTD